MPEWLIERGIGETRAALVEDGEIVEARIMLDGVVPRRDRARGAAEQSRRAGRRDRRRRSEYLLPTGAPGITEGAALDASR